MSRKHRSYDNEYRTQAVKLAQEKSFAHYIIFPCIINHQIYNNISPFHNNFVAKSALHQHIKFAMSFYIPNSTKFRQHLLINILDFLIAFRQLWWLINRCAEFLSCWESESISIIKIITNHILSNIYLVFSI